MSEAKIDLKIGAIAFSGEGDSKWLGEQLDKLLERAADLANVAPLKSDDDDDDSGAAKAKAAKVGTLASFLSASGAASNQVKRFLATSEWLHRKGHKRLTTREVSKALQDNHQKRLGNPADCLNQNVAKGHCEKASGREFFVTDDGRAALGSEV
ncbi:MAG: hypothetical protein AB7G23_08940 [Vicinamibacterales bacterium]